METVNQENVDTATNTEQQERTFTQDELNAIVEERIGRIRSKYSDYEDLRAKASKYDEAEEASKSELQKATERAEALQAELDGMKKDATLREVRTKVSTETGVPITLLTGETEEACSEQAKAILAFAKPDGYPVVKDGGEVTKVSKGTTSQQFADWLNQSLHK